MGILLVVGATAGLIGGSVLDKKNAGEETTFRDEIATAIATGGGIVKGLATDVAFYVIKETDFAEGQTIKSANGKDWIVISQERFERILAETKSTSRPVNQPTETP